MGDPETGLGFIVSMWDSKRHMKASEEGGSFNYMIMMERMSDYFEEEEFYRNDFKVTVITPDEGTIDMDLERGGDYAAAAKVASIGGDMFHALNINAKLVQVQWDAPQEELDSPEAPTMEKGVDGWLAGDGPQGTFSTQDGFLGMVLVQNEDLERSWLVNLYSTPEQRDASWKASAEMV